MITKTFLCSSKDLAHKPLKTIPLKDRSILISRAGQNYYATDAMCTHEQVPLEKGELQGTTITCDAHGAQFDVTTGRVKALPATKPLKVYQLAIEGDTIFLIE